MVSWSVVMFFVATPVLTYFFGKRWYCSWVCGCGGLAETAGDPFRHLSDKSLSSWKIERWMVHSVLVFVVLTTALLWVNSATGGWILGSLSGTLSRLYGFFIGLVFAGVIGVGFYPIMGSRVWCRFGCPMAAVLGLLQKVFFALPHHDQWWPVHFLRQTVPPTAKWASMCAGTPSAGQNIVRASCVGCGMCATVCPRGVLKLENGPRRGRYNGPVLQQYEAVSVQRTETWLSSRGLMPTVQEDLPILTDSDVGGM